MAGSVRQVYERTLWKGRELVQNNGGKFEINQMLFGDDSALVAEVKLCILESEFGCGR